LIRQPEASDTAPVAPVALPVPILILPFEFVVVLLLAVPISKVPVVCDTPILIVPVVVVAPKRTPVLLPLAL
jgi:hypothetical protein